LSDQVEIQIPKSRVLEESNFTATAYFRTRATKAASTPTTVHYSVEDLQTKRTLTDWTSVSAASSVNISITPTMNEIQDYTHKRERRQLIVMADQGLSTQAVGRVVWVVENLRGLGAE